ncbi:YheC/YheD family endospore coat-associated protein [Paenibacillus sp. An7]|uniref:YheC/YheD family endospore coat-associated protein n=1 Tax=Paenibacillus sp. An7 TaxID=2689577 RepID=UPI00135BB689|nr:YheC/YheD family protein [Paenibacillus sp. An7]
MSLTLCNLHFTKRPEKIIYLSNALIKNFQLSGKKNIHIRLGKNRIQVNLKPMKKSGKHIYLSNGVRSAIKVPTTGGILVKNVEGDEVHLGPLIGILSDGPPSAVKPFGSRTGFVKQLLREGSQKSYTFGFTPRDIDWSSDTINGYFLNSSGSFVRKRVPLPDVIYNRLPSRRSDFSYSTNQLRDRFERKNIPFFNWSFFNKSDIYKLLEDDQTVNGYVPESHLNPSMELINEMLEKHQIVYYKPSSGSLGQGIYRLTYLPSRGYFCRYRKAGGNVLLRFKTFKSLARMLKAKVGSESHDYVAQQGIRLIEIDRCPIDFRFHMHKNGNNKWVVVGIGAKKAGKGSITTHIKNGGSLMTPEQALSKTFGSRSSEVLQKTKDVAIKLAEAIEFHHKHVLGEIGFDLGIDQEEHVWMFEANAKPGRSIFRHPQLRTEGKASVEHIVDHCLYLSQFHQRENL